MASHSLNSLTRLAVAVAMMAAASDTFAQQGDAYSPGRPPVAPPPPAAKAPPPAAPKAPAAAPSGNEAGLRQRIEQLEEQIVDMQVVIGTLESLARSAPAAGAATQRAPSPGSMGASADARIDGVETQIRALTAQIEQLSEQVRAMSSGQPRRSDNGNYGGRPDPAMGGDPTAGRFGSTTVTSGQDGPDDGPGRNGRGADGRGSGGDPIGSMIAGDPGPTGAPPQAPPGPRALPGQEVAAAPLPGIDGGPGSGEPSNPKQLYETAYGYLLQQNYGAAEAAFDDFLKRYPQDALAGNAQYWLGESYFVRAQYKTAAGAFLKAYQGYGKSAKAPDSLLKLAMSLDRMGQKDAACSSYAELGTRFPNAPAHVKSKAQAERQKAGCS